MAKALVDPPKQHLRENKETWAIEQELAQDIETLSKIPGLTTIGLEYASRI
jgi:hypothetical protein